MANEGKRTWMLVLRCYACGDKFTVYRLSWDRLLLLPQILPCPHCSARPQIAQLRSSLHQVVDLQEDVFAVYRKAVDEDTWHFSEDCSKWPRRDYLVLEAKPRNELCNECRAKQRDVENN
jgi:hypothetical protein